MTDHAELRGERRIVAGPMQYWREAGLWSGVRFGHARSLCPQRAFRPRCSTRPSCGWPLPDSGRCRHQRPRPANLPAASSTRMAGSARMSPALGTRPFRGAGGARWGETDRSLARAPRFNRAPGAPGNVASGSFRPRSTVGRDEGGADLLSVGSEGCEADYVRREDTHAQEAEMVGQIGVWTNIRQWPDEPRRRCRSGRRPGAPRLLDRVDWRLDRSVSHRDAILAATAELVWPRAWCRSGPTRPAQVVASHHQLSTTYPGRFLLRAGGGPCAGSGGDGPEVRAAPQQTGVISRRTGRR